MEYLRVIQLSGERDGREAARKGRYEKGKIEKRAGDLHHRNLYNAEKD